MARENEHSPGLGRRTLPEADYLTLHVGLTPQTAGIINASSLASMKKGVRIINCARGELIVDEALVEALKSGQVAARRSMSSPWSRPRTRPSSGSTTSFSRRTSPARPRRRRRQSASRSRCRSANISKLGVVQNAVNLTSLTHEEYVELAPYITMADGLGAVSRPEPEGNIESIRSVYSGRLAGAQDGTDAQLRDSGVLAALEKR